MRKWAVIRGVLIGLCVWSAGPVLGQKPSGLLDQLQQGRWDLRPRESGGAVERVCLGDGRGLIQLRHPRVSNCNRVVLDERDNEITVQYTCKGHGFGRTRIRRESSRLIQLESQGVVDGLPFSLEAEGRFMGACAA